MSEAPHRRSVRIASRALVASVGATAVMYFVLLSEPLEDGESAAVFYSIALLSGLVLAALYESAVLVTTSALSRIFGRAPVLVPSFVRRSALTVKYASLVLVAYFGGMMLAFFVAAFAISLPTAGVENAGEFDVLQHTWIFPLGMIVGAATAWWVFMRRATRRDLVALRHWMRRPALRVMVLSAIGGLAVAILALTVTPTVIPVAEDFQPGVLAQMGSSQGWPRFFFSVMAVAIAPPVEELLFRGIFLEGLLRSSNTFVAVTTVTLAFALMHAPDMWGHWPGVLTILGGAYGLAVLRIRTGSLVPPIVGHAAYNGSLVFIGLFFAA